MFQEFIFKLMGAGIAAVIAFLSPVLNYTDDTLIINAALTSPVTEEIKELVVKSDFEFGIEYYFSIIINDKKTCNGIQIHTLIFDSTWVCDGEPIKENEIEKKMGAAADTFPKLRFKEGDEILLFIKATILPNEEFEQSTGMKTRVLWNHYVPRIKKYYIYKNGKFLLKDD